MLAPTVNEGGGELNLPGIYPLGRRVIFVPTSIYLRSGMEIMACCRPYEYVAAP